MLCRGKKCTSRISITFDDKKIKCVDGKFKTNNLSIELDNKDNYRVFHQHSEKMCLGTVFNSYGSLQTVAQANANECKIIAHSQDCPNLSDLDILLKQTKENRQKLAISQPGVLKIEIHFNIECFTGFSIQSKILPK